MSNPFTPNFGQVPYCMAGLVELLEQMELAFEDGFGDPNLTTILVGARGTGKTALMSYLSHSAEARGWVSVDVTCLPGMLDEIYDQALRKAGHIYGGTDASSRKLSGLSIGQFVGVEWEHTPQPTPGWRTQMTDLVECLNKQDVGLLMTVDEIDPTLDEMVRLAAVYQHFVREGRKVSLLMAGLPFRVSGLLGHESVSFLRRAARCFLGSIADDDVEAAFLETVHSAGKTISPPALKAAVQAIAGFPFMLQLVGFRSWQLVGSNATITAENVSRGVELARYDMKTRVLKSTLDELSAKDLDFLRCMLADETDSTSQDIAARLQKSSAHVSTYKRRLLGQGVIEPSRRGRVCFAIPMLREYLPEYLEENA